MSIVNRSCNFRKRFDALDSDVMKNSLLGIYAVTPEVRKVLKVGIGKATLEALPRPLLENFWDRGVGALARWAAKINSKLEI